MGIGRLLKGFRIRLLEARHARHADPVEWDQDELKIVYQSRCRCGGEYRFLKFYRCGKMQTVDIIKSRCSRCGRQRDFAFRPFKIHIHPEEMIRENQEFVRL